MFLKFYVCIMWHMAHDISRHKFCKLFFICISRRHSRKCELEGLQWKLKLNWLSQVKKKHFSLICSSSNIFNCHITEAYRAFYLIRRLRARPKSAISYHLVLNWQANCPYTSLDRYFCLNQPVLVMRSRGELFSTNLRVVMALML